MRTAAILPVKRFAQAKQRLGASVADPLRLDLARAMVDDVLAALTETASIALTIVVTDEPSVADSAHELGAIVIADTSQRGQSAAVALGIEQALADRIERVLCVPGDCPTLDPAELEGLLNAPARDEPEVVIVPDRHGAGTNGLLLAPPDAIPPSFGPDSCERHRALALQADVNYSIERPASLLLDIDTGEDLAVLRARLVGDRPIDKRDLRAQRTRAVLDHAARETCPSRELPSEVERIVAGLSATALAGLPEIRVGDDLATLILHALHAEHPLATPLHDGQIVVIAHKVVSKAEGAVIALADVTPGPRARELAAAQDKDARAVQVVLDQSAEILRAANGVLISRTHHGFVCANAGVDASNASSEDEGGAGEIGAGGTGTGGTEAGGTGAGGTLILLPRDPDASARALRARLRELTGASPAVLITDSFGRAWRHGQCDVAIGCAGMSPLDDWRGRTDSVGQELYATWLAVADAAAATADLARAKDSREPVVLIDGLARFVTPADGPGAAALLRPLEEDLFR